MKARISTFRTCILSVCIPIAAISATDQADARMILGVLVDPPSTAGGGATSTRSGPGTFQLYAVDDTNTIAYFYSFGISSYTITLGSAVTTSDNRSPMTMILDNNGVPQLAGFNGLRSASNAPTMFGAQPLPGESPFPSHSPFLITGMGQSASDFATYAASQPGAVVIGPTVSGSWGGPYNNSLNDFPGAAGPLRWLFIGEGTYNPSLLLSPLSIATSATFSYYYIYSDGPYSLTSIIFIPEPTTAWLAGLALSGAFGVIRRRNPSVLIAHSHRFQRFLANSLQPHAIDAPPRCFQHSHSH